jgi:hypothetical protein
VEQDRVGHALHSRHICPCSNLSSSMSDGIEPIKICVCGIALLLRAQMRSSKETKLCLAKLRPRTDQASGACLSVPCLAMVIGQESPVIHESLLLLKLKQLYSLSLLPSSTFTLTTDLSMTPAEHQMLGHPGLCGMRRLRGRDHTTLPLRTRKRGGDYAIS